MTGAGTPVSQVVYFQMNKIPIVAIAAGFRHAVALSETGLCYSWGLSQCGQCGHGVTGVYSEPCLIESLAKEKITRVSAGGSTSCVCAGMLYSALSEELGKLLADASSCAGDLTLEISDGNETRLLCAHRCLLACRAPLLFTRVSSSVCGSRPYSISLAAEPGSLAAHLSATKSLLHFIYTDRVDASALEFPSLACKIAENWGLGSFVRLVQGDLGGSGHRQFISDLLSLLPPSEDPAADQAALDSADGGQASSVVPRPAYIGAETSDVKLSIQGQVLPVHKAILCGRSEYWRTMFLGGMAEASLDVIEVDRRGDSTISYEAYLALMHFLYGWRSSQSLRLQHTHRYLDTPPHDVNIAIELIQLANMLHLHRLMSICEAMIQQSVDNDSCCFVYLTAKVHGATSLQKYCAEYIVGNAPAIVGTEFWQTEMPDDEKKLILPTWT